MASLPPGPFDAKDLEDFKARLKDLDAADREIQRAMRAGIPVQEQQERSRKLRVDILKIMQAYFPGR